MNTIDSSQPEIADMPVGKIMTVAGPIDPADLGLTLSHEHVMSTFGAGSARYPFYDLEPLQDAVIPYLARLKELGCQTLIDCTATHFGRHPELLGHFSQVSRLHILTNTGYYAAADDRYVPEHAFHESADEIAARWIRECRYTIDDTGIRPGFIKTAVDEGPLSGIDAKLITAAARTHLRTGLTIQTHTGNNWPAAREILRILHQENVHPNAWIWTHAHQVHEVDLLAHAAAQGAWLSLDGLSESSASHILSLIMALRERGHLDNLLLSHDGDTFCNGEFRPYEYLFTHFLSTMKENGLSDSEINQLTVDNPRRAFTIGVRSSAGSEGWT